MRLDPHFPPEYLVRLAQAQFLLGNYQDAAESLEIVIAANPDNSWAQLYLAAAYGQLDILDKARVALTRANELRVEDGWGPISIISTTHPRFRWSGRKDALKQGLRVAGAPTGGEWFKLISFGGMGVDSKIEGVTTIDAREAEVLHQRGVIFVDVQYTWVTSRIPGSHYLEWWREGWLFNEVALERIAAKDQEIVIYAFDGGSNNQGSKFSVQAAALAVSRGFSKVYYFAGGLDAWKAAGYTVEHSD
jgi:rhodanese-related sulfurtransferase